MKDEEIAMQLTLKAMETGYIKQGIHKDATNEEYAVCNEYNANQICKFYTAALQTINSAYKEHN